MSQNTSIEWTDATWSPLRARVKQDAAKIAAEKGYTSLIQIAKKMAGHVGPHCEHVSPGCELCYSGTNNHRCLPANGTGLPFDRRSRDLVDPFVDEKILMQPLKWKTPAKVFPMNQTDLFGEWWTDEMIDRVFAVMALCPHLTFQVLTKRPEPMLRYCVSERMPSGINQAIRNMMRAGLIEARHGDDKFPWTPWPLPNVWLGVSCENQATADARIPLLLQTPAAIRFVSYEPALGPVDFERIPIKGIGEEWDPIIHMNALNRASAFAPRLNWIIVGGESGPRARPAHPDWFRSSRDQCIAAGVPYFFKQWGAWEIAVGGGHILPGELWIDRSGKTSYPSSHDVGDDAYCMRRVGKKAAGALLDGREWKQFPEVR